MHHQTVNNNPAKKPIKKISRLTDTSSSHREIQQSNNEMYEKDSEIERIEKSALLEEEEEEVEAEVRSRNEFKRRIKPAQMSHICAADEYDSEYENTNFIVSQVEEEQAKVHHRQVQRIPSSNNDFNNIVKNKQRNEILAKSDKFKPNPQNLVRQSLESSSSLSDVSTPPPLPKKTQQFQKKKISSTTHRVNIASSTTPNTASTNDSELLNRKRLSQQNRKYSNLPVAKAFEGSEESEEDLGTVNEFNNEFESASAAFIRNEANKRIRNVEVVQRMKSDKSQNSSRKARVEQILEEESVISVSEESTEVESVVERRKTTTNSTTSNKTKNSNKR